MGDKGSDFPGLYFAVCAVVKQCTKRYNNWKQLRFCAKLVSRFMPLFACLSIGFNLLDPKVEEKISNKKQKSSDPNFQIFQVDVANLQQKIKESKFNANNDLVNETESER